MKSKLLVKVVSLLVIASVLLCSAGCGDKTVVLNSVPTVKWIIPCAPPKDPARVMEKVNEVLADKIGVKLEVEYIDPGAYKEKMNTYMAASKSYDLAFVGAYMPFSTAASKGGIVSIDKYLNDYPELKESIPDYAWDMVKYEGKTYGIPNLQVLPVAQAACISNEMLNKYGFSADSFKKIDDLEPFLKMVKEGSGNNYYAFAPTKTGSTLEAFGYCDEYAKVDNVYFKKDSSGKWVGTYKFEVPEYRKQVEKLNEFYKKGYIRKDVVSADGTSGDYAVYFAVYKPGMETFYKSQNKDVSCILIQKPVIEKCQAITALGKDSKYPVEAIKLYNELNKNKELFNLLTLGIEGENYEKTGENKFKYIGDQNTNSYWINGAWRFGNQFNAYIAEGDPDDVWEETQKYNDEAEVSPFVGFVLDPTPIRTELSQIESVINKYSIVYLGAGDPGEYYNDFLSELKKSGTDKVVAEYEKQISEFLSNR